ncbi:conjugal transfer protein TraO [Bacteroides sp. 519]|uniref:conjugal transfer protein TraO n=1 Tax=Bacteroides sp. 519 TaxID=2302937 RepID=UPI0013D5614D|nr:conjugal transfer protein TraO [Bacteroides sp. 519]NDV57948.1 conjugal transfer protein [Bacteroides sp. 519]
MKRVVLLMTLCLALIGQAHAQRYLPGQKGLQFTASAVDGFYLEKGDKQAFAGGIALSTYTKNGNRWVFGAEYLQKSYQYKTELIPTSQFTAEGGYYYKFLSDRSKIFFFSVGASAMAGYETVNWGESLLFDGSTITSDDNFLYGGAVTFEIETYLSDRIVLLLNVRERILGGSSINLFHTQIGGGIKFILN